MRARELEAEQIRLGVELVATKLRPGRYAIHPKGCLGTCGSVNGGKLWTVRYVNSVPKGVKVED